MKLVEKPSLPKEFFHTEAKPALLAQAVRVYLANQRQGNQSSLSRADVNRTRHKLYKQKGTGGARHGDRKAPIFVGGGVTFAPKPRDYSLSMSKQLKKRALYGALSGSIKNLSVISGMEKMTGKTAELAKFIAGLEGDTQSLLLITDVTRDNIYRAARNIPGVTVVPANQLNTYEVLKAKKILMMEEAIETLGKSQVQEKIIEKSVSKPKKVVKKVTKAKKVTKKK